LSAKPQLGARSVLFGCSNCDKEHVHKFFSLVMHCRTGLGVGALSCHVSEKSRIGWAQCALPFAPICCLFVQASMLSSRAAESDAQALEVKASRAQSPQCCGGQCLPLCGGEAVPSDGLCSILRNTSAVFKHDAQIVLRGSIPLRRCKTVESHSLGIVLRNPLTELKHAAQVVLSV
jgi:hypothetical protein